MTMSSRSFDFCSMAALARIRKVPRPALYAWAMPSRPLMYPPVGKSGPGTIFINSLSVASGFSTSRTAASITSRRLCGGMLVAMPTAMPVAPFTSRLGMRVGRTVGSAVLSSKLGVKSTVSFSMSESISSAMRARRASVYRMAAGGSPSTEP